MTDPTARFTGRSAAYAAARPTYPPALIELLGVRPGMVVGDLGSGTGIFTKLLLDAGATVFAIEPNDEMRASADAELGAHPRYRGVAGRAEATTLPDASCDLLTAAQAFHWFDADATRREAKRILKPGGRVALIWNDRDTTSTPFLRELEALLVARCPKYRDLQGKADRPDLWDAFFDGWTRREVPNEQRLGRAGLVLRLLSTSYAPAEGEPGHDAFVREAEALFERHAGDAGEVAIVYAAVVIEGRPR